LPASDDGCMVVNILRTIERIPYGNDVFCVSEYNFAGPCLISSQQVYIALAVSSLKETSNDERITRSECTPLLVWP